MTPKEYLVIKKELKKIIFAAKQMIADAREIAQRSKPPKNRRAAQAKDIVEGAIIWHTREQKYGGDYWTVVSKPLFSDDLFKAYETDDGCRSGLSGAYVEID